MVSFEFSTAKSVLVERGGAAALPKRLRSLGHRSLLVVTDGGVRGAGLLDPFLDAARTEHVAVTIFDGVMADPSEDVILRAAQAARGIDCVVGFGGGSSMDAAKLAALLAANDRPLSEAYGVGMAHGPRLPLVLVPTTAGTGSEVTPISIVTRGASEKAGVVSPWLLPDIALLDAELTLQLPRNVTAATGIDAMVHAIEAFTSKRLKNPISDCLAKEALRLLAGSIHTACRTAEDVDAREKMLLGACLAGMAFANAPVAAVHALAYPVGARFHVPHGLSNSLMLAPVIRFNLDHAESAYAELAEVVCPGTGDSVVARARRFVEYLESLARDLEVPTRLRDVGISESDLSLLAADAMKQTRLLVNNPRELTLADATALYREAF